MGYAHGFRWTEAKREKLKKLKLMGLTQGEIADKLGTTLGSVEKAAARYGIRLTPQEELPEEKMTEADFQQYAIEHGYSVEKIEELRGVKQVNISTKRFDGDFCEIGLVGDTQIGSKYQQMTYLHQAYELFANRGITTVFHTGDLVDGWQIYAGHIHEVFLIGHDEQYYYAKEHYPKKDGITTYVIGGQHDYVFWKRGGFDIIKRLAESRDDIKYLGYFGGYVRMGRKLHYLHHPGGGIAYARSYKTQKMVENFAPELKPHFLYRGHHHIYNQMLYRNVIAIDCPCFQAQTPYLAEKGYNPEIGFLILKFRVNDVGVKDNLAMYAVEHFPFFIPKEKDY